MATSEKRRRVEDDDGGDGGSGGGAADATHLRAQNKALATNLYAYKRTIAALEERASDLTRKNADMHGVLGALQGRLLQVRGKKTRERRSRFPPRSSTPAPSRARGRMAGVFLVPHAR